MCHCSFIKWLAHPVHVDVARVKKVKITPVKLVGLPKWIKVGERLSVHLVGFRASAGQVRVIMWFEHGGSHGKSEVLWKLFGCGRMYGCVEKIEGRLRSERVSMKASSSVSFSTVTEVYAPC
jgi:hypothetical protein